MKDITSKKTSLREATASGLVIFSKETLQLIKEDKLPKGDLLNIARASGFLAAKQTPNLIPHCHPISIDSLKIDYEFIEEYSENHSAIKIISTGKSIHKTGIEMEILTSVSITALTIYDLLKPVDKDLKISEIELLDKKGGKTDKRFVPPKNCTSSILVCSNAIYNKEREDKVSSIIKGYMENHSIEVKNNKILPNNIEEIQNYIKEQVNNSIDILLLVGGTGLSKTDNTYEAIKPLLDKEIPGISEAMRSYGISRSPLGMFSRTIAGVIENTLIIAIPGSSNGARESLDAILPGVFHSLNMVRAKE